MESGKKKEEVEDPYVKLAKDFYDKNPFMYDEIGVYWMWNNDTHNWNKCDEVTIINQMYSDFKYRLMNVCSVKTKTKVVNAMKMVGRMKLTKKWNVNWIQLKDKIYDFKTKEIFLATPDYFNCNVIPWEIGESEETPKMDKYITSWVGEKYLKSIYQICAYCLIKDYPLHRIFLFNGSGSNGKSCMIKLIEKLVGLGNTATTELEALMERFGTTVLHQKIVCLMGETNFNRMNKTSLLKKLSGNDPIDYEMKGKDRFSGKSFATLIIATNSVPTTSDKTDGFYRRWMIIDFPNKFTEKFDVMGDIPDIEYSNLVCKCLNVLPDLLENREFCNEGSVEERKKKYEDKSNPLNKFISENCIEDINGMIPIFKFYDKYIPFLKQRGYRTISKNELGQNMREEGFEVDKENIRKDDGDYTTWKVYRGLRFKKNLDDYSTDSTVSTIKPTSSLNKGPSENCGTIGTNSTKIDDILLLCHTNMDIDILYRIFTKEIIDSLLKCGDLIEHTAGKVRSAENIKTEEKI